MSKVLPILFNTEMVRAILDGRKTVTRRVVDVDISNQFDVEYDRKTVVAYIDQETGDSYAPTKMCRYQPGDILYVRETWCLRYDSEKYFYKADKNTPREEKRLIDYDHVSWKPSIHMPKEAARIWLKVKDVRVERLQEIDEEQARKEGCQGTFVGDGSCMGSGWDVSPVDEFSKIWNSTIKKFDIDRYGWDANPWVWVIEFNLCEKPED